MNHTVVDLFSGGGGASAGFAQSGFKIVGAADAELGKPSSKPGTLRCNSTYEMNLGLVPVQADLGQISPHQLTDRLGLDTGPDVLIACPPCTGFSRTNAQNHVVDDERNALVPRVAGFVRLWRPQLLVMENARELVSGRFRHHLDALRASLEAMGYTVSAKSYFLNEFGLPQRRERAIVIATRRGNPHRTLSDVWAGWRVDPKATNVRRAIWHLPTLGQGQVDPDDHMHISPGLSPDVLKRLSAIPHDGGSWIDLVAQTDGADLMTPSMRKRFAANDVGSHPDVYGRMAWDKPAPTIKRECGHIGNGRYAHPNQDRLCSVREMGILNGFPSTYEFDASVSNAYRHIGDAVPPLISFQLAQLAAWILGGERPTPEDVVMPQTHLTTSDILTR